MDRLQHGMIFEESWMISKLLPDFLQREQLFADVELMKKYIGKDVKVKAAGGISSFDDARKIYQSWRRASWNKPSY